MSDYVHNKSIMYPITKEDCAKLGIEDAYDLDTLDQFAVAAVDVQNHFPKFRLNTMGMEGANGYATYLTINCYHSYGDECSDFGRSRFLTETEQSKYIKFFREVIPDADPAKLKYVDYCWYNCGEPDDYYLMEDDFSNEV